MARMYSTRRRKSPLPKILLFILLVGGAVGVWLWSPWEDQAPAGPEQANAGQNEGNGQGTGQQAGTPDGAGNGGTSDAGATTTTQPVHARPDRLYHVTGPGVAPAAFQRGMELRNAEPVKARGLLASALNSGALSPGQRTQAREVLTQLANLTIFSPRVFPDDPYTMNYRIQPGDVLAGRRGVVRRMNLRVPSQLLMDINGFAAPNQMRAGQSMKLIQGPFHAVVDKSNFTMDLYLHDVFVRRIPVCVGADETPTPTGWFRLVLGGKLEKAPYTPPLSTGLPQIKILPGQAGYPLGRRGLWIGLEGIREKGTMHTVADGYGIHGTNEPTSIGKAASHGCIRLGDDDIAQLYTILYEHWSTVHIQE